MTFFTVQALHEYGEVEKTASTDMFHGRVKGVLAWVISVSVQI